MNNDRRNRLTKAIDKIAEVQEEIQMIIDEEEEALANLPDSIRDGERGEKMQEAVDTLEQVISDLDDVMSNITQITTS